MIGAYDAIPLLLEASPSFLSKWREFLAGCEDDEIPQLKVSLEHFAAHLVELAQESTFNEFPPIFACIERMLGEGSHYVEEATANGLLARLRDMDSYTNIFERYMEVETWKWWSKLNDGAEPV